MLERFCADFERNFWQLLTHLVELYRRNVCVRAKQSATLVHSSLNTPPLLADRSEVNTITVKKVNL